MRQQRWFPVAALAIGLFAINVVARLVTRFAFSDDDAAETRKNADADSNGRNVGSMWGNYVAYSKICTHAGCPASLYEQQTNRLLCPCHQSTFAVLEGATPVYGPAARALRRRTSPTARASSPDPPAAGCRGRGCADSRHRPGRAPASTPPPSPG